MVRKHKKNFRKVPPALLEKIKKYTSSDVVVACVRRATAQEITSGKFAHLGLTIQNGNLTGLGAVVPPTSRGRYSKRNVHGHVVVRKDLPKVTKFITVEVPNFGDWSKGSHDITWAREVYQRQFFPPPELELNIELMSESAESERSFLLKFSVEEVINAKQKGFLARLLANINLLQENVGAVDVFPSDATQADYLRTVVIDWEILPIGSAGAIVTRLVGAARKNRTQIEQTILARQQLLTTLGPVNWIMGTSGFRRYFGAKFKDDLVVFENIEYGNAIYVMFENWATLSKRSRLELLANPQGFVRIVHKSGWEQQLIKLIRDNTTGPERQAAA